MTIFKRSTLNISLDFLFKRTVSSPHMLQTKHPKKISHKLITLGLVATTYTLSGCQTTTQLNDSTQHKYASLAKTNQVQLLNNTKAQSTSQLAKESLFEAIVKNLDNDSQSITRLQYTIRPYLEEGSIDANSRSFYQSVLAVIQASSAQSSETEEEVELSDEELDAIIEKMIATESVYDVDANGLEDNGQELSDEDFDATLEKMMAEDASYNLNQIVETDAESDELNDTLTYEPVNADDGTFVKAKKYIANYKTMKQKELRNKEYTEKEQKSVSPFNKSNALNMVLDQLKSTPQQIKLQQAYYLDNYTVNHFTDYQPSKRLYQGVLSFDYANKTQSLSAQLPYSLNFERGSMTVDPSAAMPLLNLLDAEKLELFQLDDLEKKTVQLTLPDNVLKQLPTAVIFDAMIAGTKVGFSEMDSENYTAVDISQDSYAKQVGADKAIKVNFNNKQSADFIARVLKTMGNKLKQEIDNNPEKYKDADTLRSAIDVWSMVSSDLHATDIGSMMQIIEGLLPIQLSNNAYYYLSADNSLLGTQAKLSIGSEFYGMTTDSVTQTDFNQTNVKTSPLYALFEEDFGVNALAPVNGNKFITNQMKMEEYERMARYARYEYEDMDTATDSEKALLAVESANVAVEEVENNPVGVIETASIVKETDTKSDELIDNLFIDNELTDIERHKKAFEKLEK